jgi:glycosyltransferase involved in cell wall biosynthesis
MTLTSRPLVSILIPTFNRADLIASCVQSALDQSIRDIEIIVSDNASTDGTWNVLSNLAQGDSRIRIFRNDANLGPVRNWKKCIERATGKYAKLLFSDDLIFPTYLEKTLESMREDVGFVFSSAVIGPTPSGGSERYQWFPDSRLADSNEFIRAALTGRSVPVSPGAALFRLEDLREGIVDQVPSPTITDFQDHGAGIDLLIYLLTAKKYPLVGYVRSPLCFFRSHPGSITMSSRVEWLRRRYLQACVWFAIAHLSPREAVSMMSKAWLFEMRYKRTFMRPSSIVKLYSTEPCVTPTAGDLCVELGKALIHRSWKRYT